MGVLLDDAGDSSLIPMIMVESEMAHKKIEAGRRGRQVKVANHLRYTTQLETFQSIPTSLPRYNSGYDSGYKSGYNSGYKSGYRSGYKSGYKFGTGNRQGIGCRRSGASSRS